MKTLTQVLLAGAVLGASASAHATLSCAEEQQRGIFKCIEDWNSAGLYRWTADMGLLDPADPVPVERGEWEALAYCANRLPDNLQATQTGSVNVFFPFYTERTIGDDGQMFVSEPLDSTSITCREENNAPIQFADETPYFDYNYGYYDALYSFNYDWWGWTWQQFQFYGTNGW